jgi:hypothetical protein
MQSLNDIFGNTQSKPALDDIFKKSTQRPSLDQVFGGAAPASSPWHINASRGVAEMGTKALSGFAQGLGNTAATVLDASERITNPGQAIARDSLNKQISNAKAGAQYMNQWGMLPQPAAEKAKQIIQQPNMQTGGDLIKKGSNWLAQQPQQAMNKVNTSLDGKSLNYDSGAGQFGGVVGSLASQVPAVMTGSGLTHQLSTGAKGVLPAAQNLGAIVAGGSIGTQGITAATEGRLANQEELLAGGAIDAGMSLLGGGLGKLSKNAYRKILGLTNKEHANMSKRGLDLAGELSKKGYISTTKEGLAKKANKDVTRLTKQLDDLIAKADAGDPSSKALLRYGQKVGVTADDLTKDIRTKVLNDPRLKPKFGEMKSVQKQLDTVMEEFKRTVGDRNLTLADTQFLKKKLGNSLTNLLSKAGDAKGTARELANDVIRDNAKLIVEQNVKGAAKLNAKMRPLIEASKQLKKKGDYSGYLADVIIGSGLGLGSVVQGKPEDALMNVVGGLVLKRGIMSPLGRSLRGSVLSKGAKTTASPALSQLLKNLMSKDQ